MVPDSASKARCFREMRRLTCFPGSTPYSARICRTAPTSSCTMPNSFSAFSSGARLSGRGHSERTIVSSGRRPGKRFHRASVMNGMMGCRVCSATSKVRATTARATSPPGVAAVEAWLYLLQVPVRQVAPEEMIDGGSGLIEPVFLVVGSGHADHGIAAGDDPPVGEAPARSVESHPGTCPRAVEWLRRRDDPRGAPRSIPVGEVGQDEPAGVPDLVGEIPPRRKRGLEVVGVEDHIECPPTFRQSLCNEVRRRRISQPPPAGRSRCPATSTSCGAGCLAPSRAGRRSRTGISPMNSHPAITIRATQKNRISGAVTSTEPG